MPGKGCYTCRRRRIVCDNRLPTCQKCENAGKECLGYQKPLVWVKGVASRGKMVGRNMDDVMSTDSGYAKDIDPSADKSGLPSTVEDNNNENDNDNDAREESKNTMGILTLSDQKPGQEVSSLGEEHYDEISKPSAPTDYVPTPRVLIDPLFSDFNWLSRSYMFHCKGPIQFSFDDQILTLFALYLQSVSIWLAFSPYIPTLRTLIVT